MTARQHDAMIKDGFEQDDSAKRVTLKRRGLIAGAAALVAGIVATRTAAPVAAGTDGDISLDVFNDVTATTGVQAKEWNNGISAYNWSGSPVFKGDASLLPDSSHYPAGTTYNVDGIQGLGKGTGTGVVGNGGGNSGIGVYGFGAGTAAGVQGFGGNVLGAPGVVGVGNTASANNGEGVRGFGANGGVGVAGHGGATNATGVIGFGGGTSGQGVAGIGASGTGPGIVGVGGNFGASNNADGVQGFANGTGGGVVGHGGGSNGTGLLGFGGAANGQGVAGIGNGTGPGIVGVGGNFVATNNADGVRGFASGTGTGVFGQGGGTNGVGVIGTSTSGTGVYGSTSGAGNVAGLYGTSSTTYGIIGNTTAAGYSGLTGITSTPGVAALAASSTTTAAYAAYFTGTTVVQGNFYVVKNPDGTGGGKFAAVAHADGSYRGVYCTESPEPWFEDFGEGKVVNGRVDVPLDPEFAALIHTDTYHVFLTAHSDQHLHVPQRTPTGFSVAMTTVGAGQGAATAAAEQTFSWRVVGKRKDIAGTRLQKVDLPKIKTPDMATLLESAKPTTPPKVTARVTPQLPKQTEPPVLPDARQPNPPKKP